MASQSLRTASATAQTSFDATNDSTSGGFLLDDDEETLHLLLTTTRSSDAADADAEEADLSLSLLSSRLQGLISRFLEEHQPSAAETASTTTATHWNDLVNVAKDLGFAFSSSSSTGPPPTTPLPEVLPAAFDSEQGKLHLQAASSLLGVSERQAALYTLSALRSVVVVAAATTTTSTSSSSEVQLLASSLLGTRALLEKVVEYYYRQRVAQVAVITECLRLEQEEQVVVDSNSTGNTTSWRDAVLLPLLRQLDQSYAYSAGGNNNNNNTNARMKYRGLFRILLSLATQPDVPLTRSQFGPAIGLREPAPRSLEESMILTTRGRNTNTQDYASNNSSSSSSWDHFVHTAMQKRLDLAARERLEALEGLVALLYSRLDGGVRRIDLALILIALESSNHFYTNSLVLSSSAATTFGPLHHHQQQVNERMAHLAGLVCVECMGLWRLDTSAVTNSMTKEDDALCAEHHPLLKGIVDGSERFEEEIELILSLLRMFGRQVPIRHQQEASSQQQFLVPEGLAIFSFGLMLSIAYNHLLASRHGNDAEAYWQTFQETGLELSSYANDTCQSFYYLYLVIKSLVDEPPPRPTSTSTTSLHVYPYELRYFCIDLLPAADDSVVSESSSERELSAPSLLYASIGRELLVAMVLAYEDTLLSVHHKSALENIGKLSNLSFLIFRNSPTLCVPFWEDWTVYTTTTSSSSSKAGSALPLCRVLDSAYMLVKSVLSAHPPKSTDEILRAVSPLLTFASCLVYDAPITELVLQHVLPAGLIRTALEACSSSSHHHRHAGLSANVDVLAALCVLARTGNSNTARRILREALEKAGTGSTTTPSSSSSPGLDGPRLLVSIAAAHSSKDSQLTGPVYSLISELMQDAPESWVMDVAISLQMLRGRETVSSTGAFLTDRVGEGDAGMTASIVLMHSLVKQLNRIVFCDTFVESSRVAFVAFLEGGVNAACSLLSVSLATIAPRRVGETAIFYDVVRIVLECLGDTLSAVRFIAELHGSETIRDAAERLRRSVVSTLATNTGLGHAVWYYACCPSALVLAGDLVDFLSDVEVVSSAGEASASFGSLGPAMRHIAEPMSQEETLVKAGKLLVNAASDTTNGLDFDFEKIVLKGWIRHDAASTVLQTSLAALRLLLVWSRNVEDIVSMEQTDLSLLSLSPYLLLLNPTVVPPVCRSVANFSSVWNAAGMNNLSLLMHFMAGSRVQLPAAISIAAFDLLFITLAHAKASSDSGALGSSIIRACCDSKVFRSVVERSVASAVNLSEARHAGLVPCVDCSVILRCLRAVSLCIGASPSSAISLFGADPSAMIANLCDVVTGTIRDLQQQGTDPSVTFADVGLVNRLRIAVGSLDVIRNLWVYVRNDHNVDRIKAIVEGQSLLMSHLANMVFVSSSLWFSVARTESAQIGQRLCFCLTSLCLELLTFEMESTCNNQQTLSSDHPVILALQTAMGQQLSRFVALTSKFLSAGGLVHYAELLDASSRVGIVLSPTSRLHVLSETGSLFGPDHFVECNGYNIFATNFLSTFQNEAAAGTDLGAKLRGLAIARSLLDSELQRIHSWQLFSESFARLLQKWRWQSPSHPLLLSMPSDSFSLEVSNEVSRAMYGNLVTVEQTQFDGPPALSPAEIIRVAGASSSLLISFAVSGKNQTSTNDAWRETVELMSECSRKLVSVLGAQTPLGYVPLQHVVTSTVTLFTLYANEESSDETRISLAATCCEVLSRLEKTWQSNDEYNPDYRNCFCSCVLLLTALTVCVEADENRSPHRGLPYSLKLHEVFVNHDVVASIMRQTTTWAGDETDKDYIHVLSTTLSFFTSVAAGDDTNLIALVMNEATSLLARCACVYSSSHGELSAVVEGLPLRGYMPIGLEHGERLVITTAMAGMDDSTHEIWRGGLSFISTALRSSSLTSGPTRRRIVTVSMDFFKSYKSLLLSCLQQCCVAAPDSRSHMFTLNLLRETKLVLSVASELCSRNNVDSFQRECADIYATVVSCCLSLVGSIGSFLGACAASRELFKLMSEYEKAGEVSDYQLAPQSPAYHLLATSGVPNAKHEAIRFSHFVSRLSTAVTEAEINAQAEFPVRWKPHLAQPSSGPQSLSFESFETQCRISVTSRFAFEIEEAAAETLFLAAHILWSTHPASTSFVTYSEDEVRTLEVLPLVRPGAVISFRLQDANPDGLSLVHQARGEDGQHLVRFGEVLQSDTYRRQWRVSLLGGGEAAECLVSDYQLAGVEDTTKRRCILSYAPAPETSADLEAAMKIPSVGHLILAMRWCHQTQSEMKCTNQPPLRTVSLVRRLAELSAAMVGTELSIHRIIGSQQIVSKQGTVPVFSAQLVDLFGDVEEMSGVDGISQSGRLKEIISASAWTAIREQLRPELDLAREEIESNRSSPRRQLLGGDAWIGIRRSGNRSPFRGLGI